MNDLTRYDLIALILNMNTTTNAVKRVCRKNRGKVEK